MPLKEKLPQAFMQIGWMEDDFRNLTAKVWANLESRDMSLQRFHWFCVCRPLRWHSFNICDVTTVQLSNGTVQKFWQNFTFHENVSSLFFYTLGLLGLRWMCMHLERKIKKCWKSIHCTKSMESCSLVISHILAEFHPEWATYTTLHNHFS